MRGLRCGLLEESLGCGGLTLANELDNPSCRTFYREPASNGNFLDYSNRPRTVSNRNPAECYGKVSMAENGASDVESAHQSASVQASLSKESAVMLSAAPRPAR